MIMKNKSLNIVYLHKIQWNENFEIKVFDLIRQLIIVVNVFAMQA